MKQQRPWILSIFGILPFVLVACSGDNPAGSSGTATIRGTINGRTNASASSAASGHAEAAQITITVMGTNISTVTDSGGSFVLTGVPTGDVTLRFQGKGVDATLTITGLTAGQTLTISVKVNGSHAERDDDNGGQPSPSPSPGPTPTPSPDASCFGLGEHAEVEGNISQKGTSDVTVHQNGKGDFLCLVSPSTRIRHGNKQFTFDQLEAGDHVHVKGSGLGSVNGMCEVQADEVKVQ